MNQRLISRELLPRLPSCQPGASQPCPGETGAGLRIVAWRGNYLLSRHSIYRYLQQHCVIAETHHSQLSAAREVGKITAPLSISFSRSEDQDCVLFSSCHCTNTDITKPRCAITCSPQCDGCGVECAILGPLVAGLHLSPVPRTSRCLPSMVGTECQHRTAAVTREQVD